MHTWRIQPGPAVPRAPSRRMLLCCMRMHGHPNLQSARWDSFQSGTAAQATSAGARPHRCLQQPWLAP